MHEFGAARAATVLLAIALALSGVALPLAPIRAAAPTEDLRAYYPNDQLVNQRWYLDGFNYVSGSPQRSVLWFELLNNDRFKQYNSGPEDAKKRCHWDLLQWQSQRLVYSTTQDSCGSHSLETIHSPAIPIMPRYWKGGPWSASGTSGVSQIENGTKVCAGSTTWQATILGWEEIAPSVQAIHVRSVQTIKWTEGQSPTGCAAGFTTNWQEDYYLVANLPKTGGGTAKAMKRSVGGNQDMPADRWDVWFDSWRKLPK